MRKTFIIVELSTNHNGSKATAIETIKAAKRAGADAITLNCSGLRDGKYLVRILSRSYEILNLSIIRNL
jgi:hypothetical protein